MKRVILNYSIVIYLICFVLYIANVFLLSFTFNTFFFLLYSSLCLIAIYFIFKEKYVKQSLMFLGITNLLQSFSLIIFGLSYKFILGPDVSLYLINTGDRIVEFSLKMYNVIFYVNKIKGDNTLFLGINFIHLFLFFGFVILAQNYSKK